MSSALRGELFTFLSVISLFIPGYFTISCLAQEPPPWQDVVVIPKPSPSPEQRSALGKISKIVIFTTPFCDDCKPALAFLTDRGLEFEQRDVMNVNTLMGSLVQGSNRPVIEVFYKDGSKRKIIGFDKELLEAIFPVPPGSDFDLRNDEQDSFEIGK